MNTFNRKALYAALAGVGALSGVGAAEAVNLSPDGVGQVLIYPYYTVRNGANGFAYNTLLSVVNTTASAKAVKVRFLEGKNSQEVLDFNLFLSKFDVWTAAVVATDTGAAVTSTDKSCILPRYLAANGEPFTNVKYITTDKADPSLDRTREGYIEIIEMATYAANSSTSVFVTHVAGVPLNCSKNTDTKAAAEALPGTGGLFGAVTLINVFDGSAYSQNATTLDNFNKEDNIYFPSGSELPNLSAADPTTSVVIDPVTGSAVVTDWGPPRAAINSVSAVLMHESLMNEYTIEPTILGNTDWVITMPTKNQYVRSGTGAAFPPFQSNFNGNAGSCDDISLTVWDREERTESTPGGFSPPQPGFTAQLCWEANVITFKAAGVLGSKNSYFRDVSSAGFNNGWGRLDFIGANAFLAGGATTTVSLIPSTSTSSSSSATYVGLPVVGFAVQAYNNNVIVVNGKNVQSTYGADFAHKYVTTIESPEAE